MKFFSFFLKKNIKKREKQEKPFYLWYMVFLLEYWVRKVRFCLILLGLRDLILACNGIKVGDR